MKDVENPEKIFGKAIGQIIHDIRNPLNTIIGFSSIVRIDETVNAEIRKYLEKIFYSGMAIEKLLSNIDFYMLNDVSTDAVAFDISTALTNYLNTQTDIVNEKQIKVENLTENPIEINFSLEVFNKLLDNLFYFSIKGLRTVKDKVIQLYFTFLNDELIFLYSDNSEPVFIEGDYFTFDEVIKYRRGLSVMFIEKYVHLYGGNIQYAYGQKWNEFSDKINKKFLNNHGFIMKIPKDRVVD